MTLWIVYTFSLMIVERNHLRLREAVDATSQVKKIRRGIAKWQTTLRNVQGFSHIKSIYEQSA